MDWIGFVGLNKINKYNIKVNELKIQGTIEQSSKLEYQFERFAPKKTMQKTTTIQTVPKNPQMNVKLFS